MQARRPVSVMVFLRAAQGGGLTLEAMLRGGVASAGRCSTCGVGQGITAQR
jgi:hypothetical protein